LLFVIFLQAKGQIQLLGSIINNLVNKIRAMRNIEALPLLFFFFLMEALVLETSS